MNLLLLLSAMLSALTGIGSSTRAPEAAAAIAAKVEVARVAGQTVIAPSVRPIQSIASVGEVARASSRGAVSPMRDEPLYMSRRRE